MVSQAAHPTQPERVRTGSGHHEARGGTSTETGEGQTAGSTGGMFTEGAPPTPEADYQEVGPEEAPSSCSRATQTESDSAESDSDLARPRRPRKRKQENVAYEKWFAPVRDDLEYEDEDPTQGKISDWITDQIELSERQRLRDWYWMDALGIDLSRDHGWLGWSTKVVTPKFSHPLRFGKIADAEIPKWLSAASLQKLMNDTFDPDDRELTPGAKVWLRKHWAPVIERHRAWLLETRRHDLELLDKKCWREEEEKSKMMGTPKQKIPDRMKQDRERRTEQLKKNRSYYSSATKGNKLTLKWVPKLHPYNVVQPTEASGGTAEVPRDRGETDYGRGGVMTASDVANLK